MNTIYKFKLKIGVEQTIEWPEWTRPIHVGWQDWVTMWAEVLDTDNPKVHVTFLVVGTGWEIPAGYCYIGTVQAPDNYVWHVFQRTR